MDSKALASPPFTFVVGEAEKEFVVHSALIARHSEPLANMMSRGDWKESSEKRLVLTDVDESTFLCFSQFLYCGNYTPPDPVILHQTRTIGREHQEAIVPPDDDDWSSLEITRGKKKAKKSLVWEDGESLRYDSFVRPRENVRARFEALSYPYNEAKANLGPRPNPNPLECYTSIFLCHASLYSLADKYQIKQLKQLSLTKLHRTLDKYTVHAQRRDDILELINYAYDNDNTADQDLEKIDPLRDLVVRYAVCISRDLLGHKGFQELLQAGGQFARDFPNRLSEALD